MIFFLNTPGHDGSTRFNDKPGQPVKLRFKRSDRLTHRPTHSTGSITGPVLLTLSLNWKFWKHPPINILGIASFIHKITSGCEPTLQPKCC